MSIPHTGTVNFYECPCGHTWQDEWCCGCDDQCSNCRRYVTPAESDRVTACSNPECVALAAEEKS